MSDSVRPHRRQPNRLPCPWDPPGKNTGLGCHFLLQCMKVKSESEVAQSCPTLCDPMDCSLPGSSIHGVFQARVLEWGAIAFSICRKLGHHLCKRPLIWPANLAQTLKTLPANAGDPGSIPGLEDVPDMGMATHSNILAWRIPWTEEPGGLKVSPWGRKESVVMVRIIHT